jgi:hypothetical protein
MPKYFPVAGEIHGLARVPKLPATIGGCKISNTTFHNNSSAIPTTPSKRLTIRDVGVYRCRHFACSAYGVLFEDVTVTDIRGGGRATSFLHGCVYSRVVLRGWIGGVLFRWFVDPNDNALSEAFLAANLQAYSSMDWALDISEASFSIYQDLLGVPATLVRRDPKRHFLLKRDAAMELAHDKEAPLVWQLVAKDLVERNLPDTIVVTGGSGKQLRAQQDEARTLQDRGLLE